jgi:hypothetical protein
MKHLLAFAVCASLLGAGAVESREIKIKQQFAGAGPETAVDSNQDGNYAFAFTLEARGGAGRSTVITRTEYGNFNSTDCPGALPTSYLVQNSMVQTFSDLSTLHFVSTSGRVCYDPSTSEISCEEAGKIVGGTGRFEGATGSWTMECEIAVVEKLHAVTGEVRATIDVPRRRDH